jgi:protein SCO1/2
MKSKILIVVIIFGLGFLFKYLKSTPPQPNFYQEAPRGGDFTLQSDQGPLRLHELEGKVRLLYFGFTTCPDICPTTLSKVRQALKSFSAEEVSLIRLLFISVDPERDELSKLKAYVHYFHPNFIPLVGKPEEIAQIAKMYGAYFKKVDINSSLKYTMDHTTSLFLISKTGAFERTISMNTSHDELVAILKQEISR